MSLQQRFENFQGESSVWFDELVGPKIDVPVKRRIKVTVLISEFTYGVKMKKVFFFFDTMIFLHFQEITSINLLSLFKCESAVLVIPRITVSELDLQKVNGNSPKIRDRARRSLNLIEEFTTGQKCVRDGVTLEFDAGVPDVDFTAYGLERSWQDDYLIATVLCFIQKRPDVNVCLVSDDTGVRMKCRTLGINAVTLPENLRSKEETDPREEENRKLKQRVQQLENSMPKLQIVFADSGSNFGEFFIKPPLPIDDALLEERAKAAQDVIKNHVRAEEEKRNNDRIINQISRTLISERDRFARECREFPDNVREFEKRMLEYQNLRRRSFTFNLSLKNEGTCAAKDIDIHLHFPDGFRLKEGGKLPFDFPEPRLPEFPRNEWQLQVQEFAGQYQDMLRPIRAPKSDRFLSIRRTNSYDVKCFLSKLKHGLKFDFPIMLLSFDKWDDARSFKCEYTLKVENLPKPIHGSVDFVVKKVENE